MPNLGDDVERGPRPFCVDATPIAVSGPLPARVSVALNSAGAFDAVPSKPNATDRSEPERGSLITASDQLSIWARVRRKSSSPSTWSGRIALLTAQFVMVLIMTMTPVHLHGHGLGVVGLALAGTAVALAVAIFVALGIAGVTGAYRSRSEPNPLP